MRIAQLVLGAAISIFCVWLSMRDVRPGEVIAALAGAHPLGFVGVVCTTLLGFWIRAFRWRFLLTTPKPVSLGSLYSATMIGFMANNILPLRLGEIVRAWALGRREGIPKTRVFATVVVERVVDMLTLIGILGIAVLVHPLSEETEAGRLTQLGARVLVFTSVALTLAIIAIEHKPHWMKAVVRLLTAPLPAEPRAKAAGMIEHFLEGLGLFRDVPRLLGVFALSFLMFGVVVLGIHSCLWALRIDVPWYGGLMMLVITAIGIMVPAAPGYIGTMNLACIAGLALFGVGKDLAVPFSWLYWAGQWIPVSIVGFWYLGREGLSLRSLGSLGDDGA
jgi:glycosyltransferase 2 family protein